MSKQELELPKGWIACTLPEIVKNEKYSIKRGPFGSHLKKEFFVKSGFKVYEQQNAINNNFELGRYYIDKKKFQELKAFEVNSDDLIISCSGTIGKIAMIPKTFQKGIINQALLKISINELICLIPYFKYLFKFWMNKSEIDSHGSGMGNLSSVKDLKKIPIFLPPLNEQKRIVEKIEERFSELDNAKTILEKNKLQLKQYRESLLKSTFEGKLTKKWRKVNKTNLNIVLKKIELGRKSQDKKLQNIEPYKDSDFFMIPNEWKWIKVGIISKEIQYGTSEKATTTKSKIPVLRMGNIQDGELNFDNLKYYPENWKNFKQFLLKEGDVLFNRTNSAELVGKTAVYKNYHPTAVFAGYLIRVKTIEEVYIPYLLSCYVNSIFGKSYIKSVVTQQVGQANVNATKLSMMPIPLMSFEEQKEIISQLELGFSLIKNTENITNSMLSQLDTLRSSILKKAFGGKLVPQDPNDEPAQILLEKIKSNKESQSSKQRRSKNVK